MGTVGYLLDTHTLLWALCDTQKLSDVALHIIEDVGSPLFVSSVSAYEIMNKHRIGKLPGYSHVAENYLNVLNTFDANELPVNTKHAHYAGAFDWDHRDPFDRLLAAQAFIENMTLISNDSVFSSLPFLSLLW